MNELKDWLTDRLEKRIFFDHDSKGNIVGEVTIDKIKYEGKKEELISITYKKTTETISNERINEIVDKIWKRKSLEK